MVHGEMVMAWIRVGEEQDGGELRGPPLLLCLVMLILEAHGVVKLYFMCAVLESREVLRAFQKNGRYQKLL